MKSIAIALVIACLAACSVAFIQVFAQTRPTSVGVIHLSVIPTFGTNAVVIGDSPFQTQDNQNTRIDVLKFYISRIQFLQKGVVVLEEQKSFHLIDAAVKASFHFAIANKYGIRFDAVRFHLGIDSTTSVSGAMGGDLDLTKGMYWTWQSGYINFKCEGKSDRCTARNNEFQFHLGGYREPHNCLQTLTLPVSSNEAITIKFDANTFLSKTDMAKQHHIMSPNAEAVRLSAIVADSFHIVHSDSTK